MSLWLSKHLVAAVADSLARGGAGAVEAADAPQILKALRGSKPQMAAWSPESQGLAALVVKDLGQGEDWEARTEAWRRSLTDGGLLVSVDKGAAAEVSRRLLCSGFSDLTQVRIGRRMVSCGRLISVPD